MAGSTKFDGLEPHDAFVKGAIAANIDHPEDTASILRIKKEMECAGYTSTAVTGSLKSLIRKGNLKLQDRMADNGDFYNGIPADGPMVEQGPFKY